MPNNHAGQRCAADSQDRDALAEPRHLEVIRRDEEKFLDPPNCVFMATEEVPLKG